MSKKPFRETKFGKFVTEKVAPVMGDVLGIVGDIMGIEAIEKVGDLINSRKEESAELMALQVEFEKYKLEWQLEVQRIEIEAFRVEVQDRESARSREVQFMQANGGKRDWVQGGLVICTVVLVLVSMTFLAFWEIPKANEAIFHMMLGGIVVQGMNSIYNYFFGSSIGSRKKDETIKKVIG